MKYEWKQHPTQKIWTLWIGRRVHNSATIWENFNKFVWHTWDKNGVGGENSVCDNLDIAKRIALGSVIMQGFV